MVLSEGASSPESGRRAGWKLGGVVALGAIAIGLAIALLDATTPPPEAALSPISETSTTEALLAPTTSTTTTTIDPTNFTVGAIATGERLSWFKAPAFVSGWPIAMVPHAEQLWLFTATKARGMYWGGAGLTAWVSGDGVEWKTVGPVAGEEFSIASVEAVGDRLVAMGSRVSDGAPHVWISADGVDWTVSRLPVDVDRLRSGYRAWFAGAAAAGDDLHIAGFVEPDWQREVIDRLPEEVAENVLVEYGMGFTEDANGEKSIEVYGPLGLLAYRAGLGELGVDEETAARMFNGSTTETSLLWSSDHSAAWSQVRLEGMWVQDLVALPDGTLFINGGDFRGGGIWTSREGLEWERVGLSTHTRVIGTWGEQLLAVSNENALLSSVDGHTWSSLGTDEVLPRRVHWSLDQVASGHAGLAVIATTWQNRFAPPPSSVTIEEGGSTLTFNPTSGAVVVSNGELSVSVPTWRADPRDLLRVDFNAQSVAFLDPGTAETIATFSFAQLRRAETAALGQSDLGERALLLSRSGSDWIVIDVAEEIGAESHVLFMELFDDQLVMVTTKTMYWQSQEPVRYSVRVAGLP